VRFEVGLGLPLELRDKAGYADTRSLAALLVNSAFETASPRDIVCGPAAQTVGARFAVTPRHARRAIIPTMDYAHFIGTGPKRSIVTLANSIDNHDEHREVLSPAERGSLGGRPRMPLTDVSAGAIHGRAISNER